MSGLIDRAVRAAKAKARRAEEAEQIAVGRLQASATVSPCGRHPGWVVDGRSGQIPPAAMCPHCRDEAMGNRVSHGALRPPRIIRDAYVGETPSMQRAYAGWLERHPSQRPIAGTQLEQELIQARDAEHYAALEADRPTTNSNDYAWASRIQDGRVVGSYRRRVRRRLEEIA